MATITGNMVINDVIKKHPQTIKVFNDYKVDSCCGGGADRDDGETGRYRRRGAAQGVERSRRGGRAAKGR